MDTMELELVLDHICEEDTPLSRSKLFMLSHLNSGELSRFSAHWPLIETGRRRRIMEALVQIAEANFTVDFNSVFRLALTDEDAEVREQAIEGLWEDGNPGLVDALVQMLGSDPSVLVRAAAATGLGRFVLMAELDELDEETGEMVVEALWEAIHDPLEALEPRRRAVESISYCGVEGVEELIERAYRDAEEKMRISSVFSMGRSAHTTWGPTVTGELRSPNPEMRFEAARACGELELREAVPHLISAIADLDREVQQAAIFALGKIGGQEARRALRLCCESEDEVVAAAGEDALGELELTAGLFETFIEQED
jgi:HEAT repeat protein